MERTSFLAYAPLLIVVLALAALVAAISGSTLASEITGSGILLVGALLLFWTARDRWAESDAVDRSMFVAFGVLLAYVGLLLPFAPDFDAGLLRTGAMLLGMAITVVAGVLAFASILRRYSRASS